MFDFLTYSTDRLQLFFLVMLRGSGVLAFAPVLGHKSLPKMIKIGFLIILSGIIVSTLEGATLPQITSIWQLAALGVKEILVGIVISLLFTIIFFGINTAGSLVGYQMGLAMAAEFDPSIGAQVSVIGRFWYIMAILIFMSINGHHLIISALVNSYQAIPVGVTSLNGTVGEQIIRYSAYTFVIALKIAAPTIITLFLTDIALGTIAKTMPTMNVFFVGFPIKIAAGLLALALSLPAFAYVLEKGMIYIDEGLTHLLLTMGRA